MVAVEQGMEREICVALVRLVVRLTFGPGDGCKYGNLGVEGGFW